MSWEPQDGEWLADPQPGEDRAGVGVNPFDDNVRKVLLADGFGRAGAPDSAAAFETAAVSGEYDAPPPDTAADESGEFDAVPEPVTDSDPQPVPSEPPAASASGEFSAPGEDDRESASASGSFSIPSLSDDGPDASESGERDIRSPAVVVPEPAPEPAPAPSPAPAAAVEPPTIASTPVELAPPNLEVARTGTEPLEIALKGEAPRVDEGEAGAPQRVFPITTSEILADPSDHTPVDGASISAPTLFIPLLTRGISEEEDEEEGGVPDHVERTATPTLDPEDLELADLEEEPGDARPAAPPSPPPGRRRRKHWCDNVFSEHFVALHRDSAKLSASRDVDFLRECLELEPGARILDVGAGAGEHAFALGAAGFRVVGVDNSIAQVLRANEARDGNEGDVDFMHGDMRDLPTDEEFDAVICLGTTFGYFEEEQNRTALEHMRDRVKPGGRFVIQVFNRDHLVSRLPARSWWQGDGCLVLDEAEMNYFANRLRVHRTVVFEDGRQYEHYMFMRAFTLHDLGKLMSGAGLKVLEISGSRDTPGRFYGATSPDIWVIAQRPPDDPA